MLYITHHLLINNWWISLPNLNEFHVDYSIVCNEYLQKVYLIWLMSINIVVDNNDTICSVSTTTSLYKKCGHQYSQFLYISSFTRPKKWYLLSYITPMWSSMIHLMKYYTWSYITQYALFMLALLSQPFHTSELQRRKSNLRPRMQR